MNNKELVAKLRSDVISLIDTDPITINPKNLEMKMYENSSNVQYTLEEFFDQYNPEEIAKGQCNLIFRADLNQSTIVSFQLKDMYNCCGIIVGSDLYVAKKVRNLGLGTLFTKFMVDFSAYYGYGVLQGSDKKENEYQRRIFEKLGWKMINEFVNPKTQHLLNIWLFDLNEYKSKEHEN
jgi:GNAT superfamily N-acetyltransferase